MPLKRQLENQYRNLMYSLRTMEMPVWLDAVWVKATLMSVVLLFGFMYLVQTSNTATSGYEIHNLEKQLSVLDTDVQKLEIVVATESSMPNIQKRLQGTNMVGVEKIYHLSVVGSAVAMR